MNIGRVVRELEVIPEDESGPEADQPQETQPDEATAPATS
jgi:hypothetical protein